ncbi:MAG TPA: aspartate carbamoyltransferase catalytic subunit [Bacillota bacterium]|jgi:aspartate carbamoyltransferase catalytic subunit|nr:aspartate carbamoyltransferase catalytic subunit [Peptococcaceae bacterium MAG4]NLW37540.1 aspartate carbamoyltransferase catalytic subunit [Peptococcaceae bacterium]HPZ43789.1 aspartate carbamoyltransferase catalytic subunit [Bacillota bacterium]HQD76287.1 aspartate carbamoyltransferase catalytic subunit [Bacillota bacterium]HUM58993.1 aspartate carbamoyltransferase catalytic subunit [Bacillota bacterium]
MGLSNKDVTGLRDMPAEEIKLILDTAGPMKEIIQREIKKVPILRGRTVVTVFYEASTRTRGSFELAAKYLSADTVGIAAATSSISKGESLKDTARTIAAMGADLVVLRHPMAGAAELLGKTINAAVINAGDGAHEHPTQALLDLYTVREKKGRLEGLKIAIIGDILHSRVARSDIWGFTKMGAEVRLAGPATLMPPGIEKLGAVVCRTPEEALAGADVVIVLRIQLERQQEGLFPGLREYADLFGINRERLKLAARDALLMHPGPLNRGVEITADVADGLQSVINEQVTNGVAVRMALLYLLIGGGGASGVAH